MVNMKAFSCKNEQFILWLDDKSLWGDTLLASSGTQYFK